MVSSFVNFDVVGGDFNDSSWKFQPLHTMYDCMYEVHTLFYNCIQEVATINTLDEIFKKSGILPFFKEQINDLI